jgi:hypothetical protein
MACGGLTSLQVTVAFNDVENSRVLLEQGRGIDVNASGVGLGYPAVLFSAIANESPLVLDLLRRPEIDVNIHHHQGLQCSPLMKAIEGGNHSIVRALLDHPNINVNQRDNKGETALHWAALTGNLPAANLLVRKNGIKKHVRNTSGQTPAHYAASCGKIEILKLFHLRSPEARPCQHTSSCLCGVEECLYEAVRHGQEQVVVYLFQHNPRLSPNARVKGKSILYTTVKHMLRINKIYQELVLRGASLDLHEDETTLTQLVVENSPTAFVQFYFDLPNIDIPPGKLPLCLSLTVRVWVLICPGVGVLTYALENQFPSNGRYLMGKQHLFNMNELQGGPLRVLLQRFDNRRILPKVEDGWMVEKLIITPGLQLHHWDADGNTPYMKCFSNARLTHAQRLVLGGHVEYPVDDLGIKRRHIVGGLSDAVWSVKLFPHLGRRWHERVWSALHSARRRSVMEGQFFLCQELWLIIFGFWQRDSQGYGSTKPCGYGACLCHPVPYCLLSTIDWESEF